MPKRRKKSDRTYFIVSLAVIFLSLVVGYAIFSETLNITGTAQTTGNFNVEFFTATPVTQTGCTLTAIVAGDKNSLTVSVPNLAYPSATCSVNVVVKNTGNIVAKLLSATVTGNTDPDVTVTYAPAFVAGTMLAANATYPFTITITWVSASTVADHTVPFTFALNYEQGV